MDLICLWIGRVVMLCFCFAVTVGFAALVAPYWRRFFRSNFYHYYIRRSYYDNKHCLGYYRVWSKVNRYGAKFRLRNLNRYKRIKASNKY